MKGCPSLGLQVTRGVNLWPIGFCRGVAPHTDLASAAAPEVSGPFLHLLFSGSCPGSGQHSPWNPGPEGPT